MTTEQLLRNPWCVALLVCGLGGCGNEGTDVPGSGGTSQGPGAGGSSTGGTLSTGGTAGGTPSTGGTAAPGTGGTGVATGGASSGTAGTASGTGGAPVGGTGSGAGGIGETGGASAAAGRGGASGEGGSRAMGGRRNGAGGAATAGGSGQAGTGTAGAGATGGAVGTGGASSGTCTASKAAGSNASGSGPHKVTVELNSDAGIKEGTIYRPTDLGGAEKYPIFVWGEGGCSENGLSNSAAMGEIASHGYFVIADGTPNNSASRSQSSDVVSMAKPLLAYITWAIAENSKPCSAYYQSLDTTKIASNGFSCGGLMAEGTAADTRITTWGLNSSGLLGVDQAFYKTVHTPVLIVLGGSDDVAYKNGERDYDNISALGIPIMLFSKALGHGGDLFSKNGGDFTKIDVAWLNWWLKGDETATGKGVLVGSGCSYCTNSAWEVKSANLP